MIRRIGETVRHDVFYRRRPGAYAILPRGDSVLLTHQLEPEPEFQLPGGGIDPGESPMRALFREVLEETGWSIAAPRRVGAFRRFTYMPEYDLWAEKVCHVFVAVPVRRISEPLEDGHSAIWASRDTAREIVENDGDRMFLDRLFF